MEGFGLGTAFGIIDANSMTPRSFVQIRQHDEWTINRMIQSMSTNLEVVSIFVCTYTRYTAGPRFHVDASRKPSMSMSFLRAYG
eukprot:13155856-Ditylum_brightwellii.AAC.1